MLDVFENNKNKIIIGGVVLVILFVSYNIFSSDEDPIIVKLIQKEILQEVPKQIENPQIEEKGIITPKVEKKIIVKKVEEFFGKAPNSGINPDESVAQGAAIQA